MGPGVKVDPSRTREIVGEAAAGRLSSRAVSKRSP